MSSRKLDNQENRQQHVQLKLEKELHILVVNVKENWLIQEREKNIWNKKSNENQYGSISMSVNQKDIELMKTKKI